MLEHQTRETARGSRKPIVFVLILVLAALAAGYWLRGCTPHAHVDTETLDAPDAQAQIWTCSMHPQIRQPGPGQCPICAMDLIPLSDMGEDPGPRSLSTSVEALALMDIQTALVERRFAETKIRMVGKVMHDETRLASITAWVPGRIERMYADYTGVQVRQGDHMVDLYSPELLAAKEELRRARQSLERLPESSPDSLRAIALTTLAAVRAKLGRWGLNERQIAEAEASGAASDRITIYAPIGGTVIERNGQEGMFVETGQRIYRIADLSNVWVMLEAYESDLSWLHYGQTVAFATEAFPGEHFEGLIAFIDPILNERTRTVPIRVNVPNPDGKLRPGMFVRAIVQARVATGGRVMDPSLAGKWISPMHPEIVKDGPGPCDICGMPLVPAEEMGYVPLDAGDEAQPLVIPATAPLITGRRSVVYVQTPGAARPTFEGRVVELGPRAGDYYIVRRGLSEGERVVTQGNFKIDSALEIQAKPSMMSEPGGVALSLLEEDLGDLQHALRALLEPYRAISDFLAHDDHASASGRLEQLAAALAALPADMPDTGPLQASLPSLQQAESLDAMRAAFQPLSDAFVAAVTRVGMSPGEPVYRVHCPMAFDFAGGDWLQSDQEIRNPYFGSEMYACGSVEERLVDAGEPDTPRAPGGGAAHVH